MNDVVKSAIALPEACATDAWRKASSDEATQLAKQRRFIPEDIYPTVQRWSNFPTADFVCIREVSGVREFMLVRRVEPPFKDEFFVPGGRIPQGVHPKDACLIGLKREFKISPSRVVFTEHYPCFNPETQRDSDPYFTLMHLFAVYLTPDEEKGIQLDDTGSEKKWFQCIPADISWQMNEILALYGFSEDA